LVGLGVFADVGVVELVLVAQGEAEGVGALAAEEGVEGVFEVGDFGVDHLHLPVGEDADTAAVWGVQDDEILAEVEARGELDGEVLEDFAEEAVTGLDIGDLAVLAGDIGAEGGLGALGLDEAIAEADVLLDAVVDAFDLGGEVGGVALAEPALVEFAAPAEGGLGAVGGDGAVGLRIEVLGLGAECVAAELVGGFGAEVDVGAVAAA